MFVVVWWIATRIDELSELLITMIRRKLFPSPASPLRNIVNGSTVRKEFYPSPFLRQPPLDPAFPLFKIFVSSPLFSVSPSFKEFPTVPLTLTQPLTTVANLTGTFIILFFFYMFLNLHDLSAKMIQIFLY